jgi:hypothetical protein
MPKWKSKYHYSSCIFYDHDEEGCCNGVDEETKCIGETGEDCEVFEYDPLLFGYMELYPNSMTDKDIQKHHDECYASNHGCPDEFLAEGIPRWNCQLAHSCNSCTLSKHYILNNLIEQRKKHKLTGVI